MGFNKMRKLSGQSTIEYFVIFSVIAILTILSFSSFFPRIQQAMQGEGGFFQKAAQQIISPTPITPTPTTPTTPTPPPLPPPPPTPPPPLPPGLPPLTTPPMPTPATTPPPPITPTLLPGSIPPGVTTDQRFIEALIILSGSKLGAYYAQLIIDKNISIALEYLGPNAGAQWDAGKNKISLNLYFYSSDLVSLALVTALVHEAVHADYDYNPLRWIGYLQLKHPELSPVVSLSPSSIDQEYNAYSVAALTEQELIPGTMELGYDDLYYQGEDYLKDWIRSRSSLYGGLPEY